MQADTPYDDKILRILTENLLPPVSKNAGFQKGQKWMTKTLVVVVYSDSMFCLISIIAHALDA